MLGVWNEIYFLEKHDRVCLIKPKVWYVQFAVQWAECSSQLKVTVITFIPQAAVCVATTNFIAFSLSFHALKLRK